MEDIRGFPVQLSWSSVCELGHTGASPKCKIKRFKGKGSVSAHLTVLVVIALFLDQLQAPPFPAQYWEERVYLERQQRHNNTTS